MEAGVRRGSSTVKGAGCTTGGLEFGSQQLCTSITLAPRQVETGGLDGDRTVRWFISRLGKKI